MGTYYQDIILADRPLAYYPLTDAVSSGTAVDLSGNGRTGTVHGGVTFGQTSLLTNDGGATAASFDGSSGYISLPTAGLPTGASPWSIEAWVKCPTLPGGGGSGHRAAIGFGAYANGEMAELQYYSTQDSFLLSAFSADIGGPINQMVTGVAYHLVGTYDGVNTRLYVNGVPVATGTFTLNVLLAFASIGAGNSPAADYWKGVIAHAAIYSRALAQSQITAHYRAGTQPPPPTLTSLYTYKQQIVLCFNSAGVFIDVIRDAPLLSGVKFAINSATSPLRVQLPRRFDSFDEAGTPGARGTIAQGNLWQYWLFGPGLPTSGLLKFQGVIDSYQPQIAESGEESLTVTLTPYDSVVGDNGLVGSVQFGTLGISGTYLDPVTMFNWFFSHNNGVTGKPYTSPQTLDATNPATSGGVPTTYVFQNQNLGSIFETIRKMLPANWFWRVNQNKTITLNVPPATAQHVFVIGQHLSAPQYRKDWTKLRNAIQVQGNTAPILRLTTALASSTNYTSIATEPLPFALISGQNVELNPTGNTALLLTLSANAAAGATSIPVVSFNTGANAYPINTQVGVIIQATATGSDTNTFGYRLLQVADSRVLDVNTAQALANSLLSQYDVQVLRTTIRVVDYRGDAQTGLGYDIESILPGDTVQIINPNVSSNNTLWDNAVWDSSVWDYGAGAALSQVATVFSVDYGFDAVDIEIGAPAPSQDRSLLELSRSFQDFSLIA